MSIEFITCTGVTFQCHLGKYIKGSSVAPQVVINSNPFPDPCCHSEFLILPETHFSLSYVTQALFKIVVVVVLVVVVVVVVVVIGCGDAVGSGRGSVMTEASRSSILSRHESTFSSIKLFMNPRNKLSTQFCLKFSVEFQKFSKIW